MKKIYVGLIGFGTVGAGVVKLLRNNDNLLKERLGAGLVLKKIVDLDITAPRDVSVEKDTLTQDVGEVLNDPEISIVIELMGGYEPAKSFILKAMRNKKHVVTANKALLATCGDEVFKTAEEEGVDIGFEASVGGAVPVIKTLKESLIADRIESIFGIMNGTSNYILTKMTDEGNNFTDVLKEAQDMGYAEADPAFDVDGIDTAHKLAIILSLSYGWRVKLDDIYMEGISGIDQKDIGFAGDLGYKIKLLAIAIRRGGAIEARIHPTMIPFDHLLASVNGNFNALHITCDAADSIFLYGQGSGMIPSASAVMGDLVDISRNMLKGITRRVSSRFRREGAAEDIRLMPMKDIATNYYFRFSAVDRPGVLSRISGILGKNDISLASVIQKGRKHTGAVPIVVTTHESREKNVRNALKEIDQLDIVREKTILIRIEDDRLR